MFSHFCRAHIVLRIQNFKCFKCLQARKMGAKKMSIVFNNQNDVTS